MTNILVIDSSTEACSVALSHSGLVYAEQKIAPRKHAELILPMVDHVLSQAQLELTQLDAIGCCIGPGAFTGLRIAISMVQGLALASNLDCIGITSLEALAYEAFATTKADYCLASIDARMQQVYFAVYERGNGQSIKIVTEPQVIDPDLIEIERHIIDALQGRVVKVGNGWDYVYRQSIDQLTEPSMDIQLPQAKYMLNLAQQALQNAKGVSPEQLQPLYLRNNVAKSKSRLHHIYTAPYCT
ncbi:MAG: tRNA (adenosine(37)-N6)-threonylcarbamoyltransferase complex dimerization subunit type 1 TsaB, partial [Enterobacterales bacterium]|nr:tRNA (adenosine(37)-N6)-threonylcarbamoyltransferase complex dimerization subunit type 1 TsaB [Enterobacterales bacterium]